VKPAKQPAKRASVEPPPAPAAPRRPLPSWVGWALAGVLVLVAAGWRFNYVLRDPTFSVHDDATLYWTESALQYRYAKMAAVTGALPAVDPRAEHPHGLRVRENLTTLMESAVGWTYRLAVPKSVSFQAFVAAFLCLTSCLTGLLVFGLAKTLWRSPWAGVFATAFYLGTLAAASSTLTHDVLNEDFALWFLFAQLYFFIKAWREDRLGFAALSAAFLYAAFAAWQLTQFFFLVETGLLAAFVLFGKPDRALFRAFAALVAGAALGGATLPTLAAQGFFVSMPFLAGVAVAAAAGASLRFSWARWPAFLVPLAFQHVWGRMHQKEFSHVYKLVIAKIKWLGQMPDDPAKLGWETAVMWTSHNISPAWPDIWKVMGPVFIAAAAGMLWRLFNIRRWTRQELFLAGMAAAFTVLFFMMSRLDCFFVVFLAIYAGALLSPDFLEPLQRLLPDGKGRPFPVGLAVAAVLAGMAVWNASALVRHRLSTGIAPPGLLLDLLKTIRRELPPDAALLTDFPLGPSVVAATERPILLHSKFETKIIRDRIHRFEESLYLTEDDLWRFCRDEKADYFIYSSSMLLGNDRESIRWRVNRLGSVRQTAAYRLHFEPQKLARFQWVWSNPIYQIFKVLPEGEAPKPFKRAYMRTYDTNYFPEVKE